MKRDERMKALSDLDAAQRSFRQAIKTSARRRTWLRDVRLALGVRMPEIAKMLDVSPSALFRMERYEPSGRIEMRSLERVAEAMGCKLVYCIVPRSGTLAEAAWFRDFEKRKAEEKEKGVMTVFDVECELGLRRKDWPEGVGLKELSRAIQILKDKGEWKKGKEGPGIGKRE